MQSLPAQPETLLVQDLGAEPSKAVLSIICASPVLPWVVCWLELAEGLSADLFSVELITLKMGQMKDWVGAMGGGETLAAPEGQEGLWKFGRSSSLWICLLWLLGVQFQQFEICSTFYWHSLGSSSSLESWEGGGWKEKLCFWYIFINVIVSKQQSLDHALGTVSDPGPHVCGRTNSWHSQNASPYTASGWDITFFESQHFEKRLFIK